MNPKATSLVVTLAAFAGVVAAQTGNCFEPARYRSSDQVAEENFQRGSAYFGRNNTAAYRYLSVAAQRNHPRAQELMGQIYMFGYGVKPDAKEGFRYLSAAAAQGHRGAIMDLGFYYSQVVVDLARADRYFLAAAQCGNLDAQVELALNYEFGRGVERNRQQAIYWLMKAAPHWGQAGFIAQWLRYPDTPHFRNADQLGNYISAKTRRNISLMTPRASGVPRPGTPSCYRNVSPYCASDPTSAAYQHSH